MESQETAKPNVLVAQESLVNVLGVIYAHRKTSDGGDMYFTRHGLRLSQQLAIENWYEKEWFENQREHLMGDEAPRRSVDRRVAPKLVVRW